MIFENVRKRCKARGVSINAVEAAAGIGKNVIYKWQKSQPSLKSLKAVAGYFGCTLDDLTREETEQSRRDRLDEHAKRENTLKTFERS